VKILIADDEAFFRTFLEDMLVRAGFEVVGVAKDGVEAIKMARELRPDIVMLDVVMPEMDGVAAAKNLCSSGLPLHVVMLSSVGHGSVVAEALSAGASAYINKPPKEEEVLEVIKSLGPAGGGKKGP
jgi:two-component system chemotaxis response regulator CheY